MSEERSLRLERCLDRLHGGDEAARHELLASACERLTQITRTMLRDYPRLQRWEQTDDVLQNALVRLMRALETITPATMRDFYRLATLQIRRELIDLVRHHFGPEGGAARHATDCLQPDASDSAPPLHERSDLSHEPGHLAVWREFHEQVDRLPPEEREVFDLVWYQGLGHTEAAEVLQVSARTVKRRWQSACLHLHEALHGELPSA
jgi:RNA polymerase sigma-70 factor (ECF subfamily)